MVVLAQEEANIIQHFLPALSKLDKFYNAAQNEAHLDADEDVEGAGTNHGHN